MFEHAKRLQVGLLLQGVRAPRHERDRSVVPSFLRRFLDRSAPTQNDQVRKRDPRSAGPVSYTHLDVYKRQQGDIVGIEATPDGKGYFAVSNTGAVYVAGDADFFGDLTTHQPPLKVSNIVAIAPTSDGGGYYLVGSDGGVFCFGDAVYHGSLPGLKIHVSNVVGITAAAVGSGYLLVGSDGGVFAFGKAQFHGSLPGIHVRVNNVRSILEAKSGSGYMLVGSDGCLLYTSLWRAGDLRERAHTRCRGSCPRVLPGRPPRYERRAGLEDGDRLADLRHRPRSELTPGAAYGRRCSSAIKGRIAGFKTVPLGPPNTKHLHLHLHLHVVRFSTFLVILRSCALM